MRKYLLDTNIIINLWREDEKLLNKLLKEDSLVILKEVLEELSIKETKEYRRREVLSERFCKLLPYSIEVEKENISGFYMIFDYETEGKFEKNNLSQNDLLELYACYINEELKLVTEDKELFDIAKHILGENRVLSIIELKDII
ncbi:PIN domain-containing protein [Clostridioides difficile]